MTAHTVPQLHVGSAIDRPVSSCLRRLKKELMQIERQIFDLEGSYLEETATTGNVLVGWDVVLKEG